MKKLKLTLLSICLIGLLSTPLLGAESFYYTDLTGHWAESDIYYMTNKGVLDGYPDRTFKPDKTITRAELVTILAKDAKVDTNGYTTSQFSDTTNHWAKNSINWASATGIVTGYGNGTFRPDSPILREEMAVMLNRYISGKGLQFKYPEDPFNDNNTISTWAKEAVTAMQRYGLVQGKGNHNFMPRDTATRAETATIVARYIRTMNGESVNSSMAELYVNNTLVKSNVKAAQGNSTTMVAMRDFFEAIGYEVAYYNGTSLVAAYNPEKDLEMWIGKTTAYTKGKKTYLSNPPYILEGSTMAPVSDIATALGLNVIQTGTDGVDKINIMISPAATSPNAYSFYGEATANGITGEAHLRNSGGFWGVTENGAMTYGSYAAPDGYRYFGGWSNSQFSGSGSAINPLGELSVGTFDNGYMTQGITYFVDGSTFEGEWYYNTGTSAIYPSKGVLTANGRTYGTANTQWNSGALAGSGW